MQEVHEMESKFYTEQIEIWLTEKTNLMKHYAKKLEEEKKKIIQM